MERPRFPERIDIEFRPSGRIVVIDDDGTCPAGIAFADLTGPVDDSTEIDNVAELVRRYNLHGKLVDALKATATAELDGPCWCAYFMEPHAAHCLATRAALKEAEVLS